MSDFEGIHIKAILQPEIGSVAECLTRLLIGVVKQDDNYKRRDNTYQDSSHLRHHERLIDTRDRGSIRTVA